MASPPITQNTVGKNPATNVGSPTTTTAVGASWLGRSPWTTVPYPQVSGLMWQAKGQGRFSLIEKVPPGDVRFARGPRLNPRRGTIDVWLTGPEAGAPLSAVTLGPAGAAPVDSYFLIGVDSANDVTCQLEDVGGTVVVALVAATPAPLVEGRQHHIVFSWDADAGLAACSIDGVAVPGGDFATDPGGTPWVPSVPLETHLVKESWGSFIDLVQISSEYLL